MLFIIRGARVRSLYQEIVPLEGVGKVSSVTRASNVEPDKDGQWWAEMRDGSRLGPFQLRSEALAAEVKWLEERGLKVSE